MVYACPATVSTLRICVVTEKYYLGKKSSVMDFHYRMSTLDCTSLGGWGGCLCTWVFLGGMSILRLAIRSEFENGLSEWWKKCLPGCGSVGYAPWCSIKANRNDMETYGHGFKPNKTLFKIAGPLAGETAQSVQCTSRSTWNLFMTPRWKAECSSILLELPKLGTLVGTVDPDAH